MLCGHDHDEDQLGNREQANYARPGEEGPAQPTDQPVDEDRGGHKHDEVERTESVGSKGQLPVGLQYPRHLAREGPQVDDLQVGNSRKAETGREMEINRDSYSKKSENINQAMADIRQKM